MKENKSRNVIPVGIFFIVFLIMLILSTAISAAYFYFETKNRTEEIEKYTRNFSIPLAEAFANVAELSYHDKKHEKLKKLFREKIQANIITEAFFVLSDGKIVVHSDSGIEKELKGNIATDEFAYNIDLIMLPIWSKIDHAQFMDYHVYNGIKKLKINKEIIKIIKRYVYQKIDVSGWLVTRAVFVNGKPVGCISFIISKEKLYTFIIEYFDNTIRLIIILAGISFIISLLMSIIVFIRYRSIRKKKHPVVPKPIKDSRGNINDLNEIKLKEAIRIKSSPVKIKKVISAGKNLIKDAISVKDK